MVSIAAFQAVDPGSIPGRRNFFFFRPFMNTIHSRYDEVAEWLRRWTANPMGSARVGSNPIFVEHIFKILHSYWKLTKNISVTGN